MRPKPLLCAAIIITALTFLLVPTAARATNLVYNGSFEASAVINGWSFSGGVDVQWGVNHPSPAAADGTNYVGVGGSLWQDIPTMGNETYYVRFWSGQYPPAIYFAGQPVLLTSNRSAWYLHEGYATATGAVTRLQFTGGGRVDGVQVISTLEPVQITAQPASSATLEGGSATFSVSADGGRPFMYQWLHDGEPILQATNALLYLTDLQSSNAGIYSVLISNAVSWVESTGAALTVEPPPKTPVIVAQPTGGTVTAGYAYNLSVVAIGDAPLSYQWSLNGAEMLNATNYAVTFASVQSSNAGVYSVRVQNSFGSVQSLPAALAATNAGVIGGLVESFGNIGQPTFDVDGTTKLSGPAFLAQLYAGPSATSLRAVGPARPFNTGIAKGTFVPAQLIIPDIPAGQIVYVQTRVWETNLGNFYEDVRTRGGKYGASATYSGLIPGQIGVPFGVPINNFSLRSGSPFLSTGRIEVNAHNPGAPIEWKLTGAAGFSYLIEKQTPPNDWAPLFILTNMTGTVLFTDTNAGPEAANFYRSRMLD